MRILIAEDEDDMRDVLEAYLTLSGYEAVTAKNGAEGKRRPIVYSSSI